MSDVVTIFGLESGRRMRGHRHQMPIAAPTETRFCCVKALSGCLRPHNSVATSADVRRRMVPTGIGETASIPGAGSGGPVLTARGLRRAGKWHGQAESAGREVFHTPVRVCRDAGSPQREDPCITLPERHFILQRPDAVTDDTIQMVSGLSRVLADASGDTGGGGLDGVAGEVGVACGGLDLGVTE